MHPNRILIRLAALLILLVAGGLLVWALITRHSLAVLALSSVMVLCLIVVRLSSVRPGPAPRPTSRVRTSRTGAASSDAGGADFDLSGAAPAHHTGHGHHDHGHHDHGGHSWGDTSAGDSGSGGSDSGGGGTSD